MRKIDKIIVHCSATPEGRNVLISEVKRWHVEERGWSDIGYHFVIELDGSVRIGRPIEIKGAHSKGNNHDSIGVCYIGGVDLDMKSKDTRTECQKESLVNLLTELKDTYGGNIYGHRDFSDKDCPSFDARQQYENISFRY
jgi:N-acetylmuramoyl-L-alanine amidase